MIKIRILNGNRESLFEVDKNTADQIEKSIDNCLNDPKNFPSFTHTSPKQSSTYPALYLHNSIIEIERNEDSKTE